MDAVLLEWFAANERDLPWRRTRDPYAILVSEVMLQQTQVERVVPRYVAWLERWPTVGALAVRAIADVLREWQGLGYNRRALNLHRAAAAVSARGWPSDLTELPGVGAYTAAAIRNFAFGEDVLPVDTNVRRVQERTEHRFGPRTAQALMDLGATVCLAPRPPLRDLPARGRLPVARSPLRARSESSRASRARSGNVAHGRCARSSPASTARRRSRRRARARRARRIAAGSVWSMSTRYDELIERLASPALPERNAPPEFASYLEKVRLHAYRSPTATCRRSRTRATRKTRSSSTRSRQPSPLGSSDSKPGLGRCETAVVDASPAPRPLGVLKTLHYRPELFGRPTPTHSTSRCEGRRTGATASVSSSPRSSPRSTSARSERTPTARSRRTRSGEDVWDAVERDWRTAPVSRELRATLGFLEKLTLRPGDVSREDATQFAPPVCRTTRSSTRFTSARCSA
jgi:A/G-specific adenine glycosylase